MEIEKEFGAPIPDWSLRPRPDAAPLQGQYARLERLDPAAHTADLHHANCADDGIWDYLPYGPFDQMADYRAWVEEVAARPDPHFFAVQDRSSGRFGGVASLMRIDQDNGTIEVGHINFAAPLQKTRAATEAIYLLMSWAFENGYRRFEWKCDALNMGSRRAAQRFGFSYEGVFRQALIYRGRNRDTAWFACIDTEWPELRAAFTQWLAAENFDASGQQIMGLRQLTGPVLAAQDPTQDPVQDFAQDVPSQGLG